MSQPLQESQMANASCATTSQLNYNWTPGSIKSIKLINFMCHDTFELKLGPRVNFILGPNGSGKSALLTALVACLGGRASITSRASKNADFVMYGKRQAKVIVVIHNYDKIMEKDRAFKPDEYGKSIIIEKTISTDGAATKLAMRSDSDRIISDRKSELDDMLDHFGICINNPIYILNQEVSKSFLHSKRPEDKFELFMKATNLEQIEQDYLEAKNALSEWGESNTRAASTMRQLDHEFACCKKKISAIQNRAKLRDQHNQLSHELIWAIVKQSEDLKDELTKKLQTIRENIEKSRNTVTEKTGEIQNLEDRIQLTRVKDISTSDNIESTKKKLFEIRKVIMDVKTKSFAIAQKKDLSNRKISRLKQDREGLKSEIEKIKRQLQEQNALDRTQEQRKSEITSKEKELQSLKARLSSVSLHCDQMRQSAESTNTETIAASARASEIKTKIYHLEQLLNRLKSGQTDQIRKFGDYAPLIARRIEDSHNAGKFRSKPIGPLGFHLRLINPDIASALEIHLKGNSYAYACDNLEDMGVLSSMFREISATNPGFKHPSIVVRKFGPRHDVQRYRSRCKEYKTLLDFLEIKNDVVFNAIVDRCSLESILFIPDYPDAETLMINPNTVPQNTYCAYTKDASCMFPRTARGGYKSLSNDITRCSLYSQSNIHLIKNNEKELSQLQASLRDIEHKVQEMRSKLNQQRQEKLVSDQELAGIKKTIAGVEADLLELNTTIAIQPQELSSLENEYDSNLTQANAEKFEVEKLNEELKNLNDEQDKLQKDKDDCTKVLRSREKDRESVMRIIDETKNEITSARDLIKGTQSIILTREKDLDETSKKLDEARDSLARNLQRIPENHQRPQNIRSISELRDEIQEVEAKMRIEQEETRDPEVVLQELRSRISEIEDFKKLKSFDLSNFDSSNKALVDRFTGLNELRLNTISSVGGTFSAMMRTMKMNGEIRIHMDDVTHHGQIIHKARTLEMRIETSLSSSQTPAITDGNNDENHINRRGAKSQPPPTSDPPHKRSRMSNVNNNNGEVDLDGSSKMTDSRSLSGGERSFSTVAFVLALWHNSSSPFKIMDEIDVFMDMVTRRISYNALIRFAQLKEDTGQFIFLTPLELPKIDDANSFVTVFEMPVIIRNNH